MTAPALLASIPSPSSNSINLGPIELRAYGLAIAVGVIVAVTVAQRRWAARGGDPADVSRLATWSVVAGLLGARAYHVLTDYHRFQGQWLDALKVWEGGLGIPGGLLAGVATGVILARRWGLPAAQLLDVVAPAIPVAQAIGRLGNWFNQELFGRPTDLPWGLHIDRQHRPNAYETVATFHPTFLYEALWNLALAGLLVLYERRRPGGRPGRLFALYVGGYGLGRLWVEALRIDDATRIAGVRVNIWVSLVAVASAAVALAILDRHSRRRIEESDGPPEFSHQGGRSAPIRTGNIETGYGPRWTRDPGGHMGSEPDHSQHPMGDADTLGVGQQPAPDHQGLHPDAHDGVEGAHGGAGAHASHGDHGQHAHGGKHAGHHTEQFERRFWWSLLLTIPVVATSHMVMDWFGYELDFYGIEWIGPVLGSVIFFWAGWPFLEGGRREFQERQPGMMLLIAMAITVAYVASMATSLDWFDLDFWWELAALVTIMLLGHWQEMKALGQAQDAVAALAELLPDEAERVGPDGSIETVAIDDLQAGDVVLVRSGARVPADGEIVDGSAELNESMITGESKPVAKEVGDRVVAGTVSTDSAIRVRVDAVGEETTLAGIQRLVAEAEASRSRTQVLADRAAALLFYVATGAAVITGIVWTLAGQGDEAVTRVVTVLIISCPHALGLAIPLTTSISSALAARNGILVKDRLALEQSRTVDAFLFDKTGTLTKGEHVVVGAAGAGISEDEVLRLAAGVESDSEHPLARAIVAAARERGGVATATEFRSITGRGVEATVEGESHAVGGPNMVRERGLTEPEELTEWAQSWRERGSSVLYLTRGDAIIGGIALEDEVRPEAREAVRQVQAMGCKVVLITGDARQVADAVGRDLGVDEVMAEVLPEDKDAKVAELQARGLKVAMVGDGVNDAPALARAEVGIAIGAGTDVAIESAGLILASSDPRAVVGIVRLSKAAYRKSLQNLWWAAGYNVLAIPIAAGALSWAGVNMPPALAAVLMSASTIVVALNAQLLRRVELRPPALEDHPTDDVPPVVAHEASH